MTRTHPFPSQRFPNDPSSRRRNRFIPRHLGPHRAILKVNGVARVTADYTLGPDGPETGTAACTTADGHPVDRVSTHLRRTIALLLARAARSHIPASGNTTGAGGTLTWDLAERPADDVLEIAHRFRAPSAEPRPNGSGRGRPRS